MNVFSLPGASGSWQPSVTDQVTLVEHGCLCAEFGALICVLRGFSFTLVL